MPYLPPLGVPAKMMGGYCSLQGASVSGLWILLYSWKRRPPPSSAFCSVLQLPVQSLAEYPKPWPPQLPIAYVSMQQHLAYALLTYQLVNRQLHPKIHVYITQLMLWHSFDMEPLGSLENSELFFWLMPYKLGNSQGPGCRNPYTFICIPSSFIAKCFCAV